MADKPTNVNLTGAFDLFPKSVEAVKRNLNTFSILWILPLVSVLSSTVYENHIEGTEQQVSGSGGALGITGLPGYAIASIVGVGLIIAVVLVALSLIIQAMTLGLQIEAAKGKTPALGQLWKIGKKYWLRLLGLSLLIALMVIGGLILLIIPGLIMIRRYFLAPYFMIDQDLTISEAMRRSAAASKPHSGYIWSIIGVMILLNLPGVIPVFGGAIAFLLGAAYSVAPAIRYLELKKLGT